jgi:uncharacterized membrane protein YkoI
LGLAAVTALVALAAAAGADEKKIPLDKVPKAVLASIEARFPNAKIESVEKETEGGKVVFDVELKHDGRKYEMDIKEDGTITEIEKEVAAKDAPAALLETIEAKYPKAKIEEIMEVNKVEGKKETPIHYEVTIVTAAKKKKEVVVSLDGKKIKPEKEEKKD